MAHRLNIEEKMFVRIIIFIAVFVNFALSIVSISEGVKKFKQGQKSFRTDMLFKRISRHQKSGSLLIVEGLCHLLFSIIIALLWIFYIRVRVL